MPSPLRTALWRAWPAPALSALALTGCLVVALLLTRGTSWPVRVYSVGLAATGAWLLVGLLRFAGDEPWPRRRAAPPALEVLERPRELSETETALIFARASGRDFHHRVRPQLRSIAAALLASRRSIDLDGDPEAARQALGEDVFMALQPAPKPVDPQARGIGLAELERLVRALEGL